MKTSKSNMPEKIEITVQKTIEAIARIQRFIIKYGSKLDNNQKEQIAYKVKELQNLL